jgi:hypothetical protein
VEPVLPDEADVGVFRAIVRGGFGRAETIRACEGAGWELTDEDADSGTLQFEAVFGDGRRVFVTVHRASDDVITPVACAPLGAFRGDAVVDRAPYDAAFRRVADHLGGLLGPVTGAGEYPSEASADRPLSYCWWRHPDAAVVLVQNDFGPPLPPDISLWVFPPRDEIQLPVTRN